MLMFKRSRTLLLIYSVCTALLTGTLMIVYIPAAKEQKYSELTGFRQIIPDISHCYLYQGDSDRLSVSLAPNIDASLLNWTSADDSVVTVNDGVVNAISAGETTVTVACDGVSGTDIGVTVIKKPVPPGSDFPEYYDEELLIANVNHPIGEYQPELVYVPEEYPSPRRTQVTPEMLEVYEALYADCVKATGSGFVLLSGYRSYKKQTELFNEDVAEFVAKGYNKEDAKKMAGLTTQLPGCSEHQLGLTVDISTNYALSNDFRNTKVGKWVTENCWKYGLILRYPKDKTKETGIDHEAWHFRLIEAEHSVEHAKYIYDHGLCLEEYIELQQEARNAAEEYSRNVSAEEYIKITENSELQL